MGASVARESALWQSSDPNRADEISFRNSDGSHCDPGASCYECVDYPGSVCCYDPDAVASYGAAVASYSAAVDGAYASYSAAVESANAHNSAVWDSYTAGVSGAISSYNAAWSVSFTQGNDFLLCGMAGMNLRYLPKQTFCANHNPQSYDAAISSYVAGGGGYEYQYYYT